MTIKIPGLKTDSQDEDLFPTDDGDQRKVLRWAQAAFRDAESTRKDLEDRWFRFYKMYRSWAGERPKGDWRSRVWIPVAFYVIETIVPRLVATLPKFTVEPVGPEDAEGARQMEFLLDYVTEQSDLYLELVKAFKSALIYGTGIIKSMYDEKYAWSIYREPVTTPEMVTMPSGETDVNGQPITQQVATGNQIPTGETKLTRQQVLKYAGPAGEAVDIFDLFVSPEATDIEDASYVIHRVYRTREHIERMAKLGHYRLPDDSDWEKFLLSAYTRPQPIRLGNVGLGSEGSHQQTAEGTKLIELQEIWTDDIVITTAGGQSGSQVLLRAERNPFAHGEKPFVRILDHLVPHEFWGIGELEPLEGVQSTINSLWNSRIDNVKLVLNTMFAVSIDYLEDPNDLIVKPGGVVRLREGVPIDQAIKPINLGEVTQSSYTEAAEMERLSEKISGVSAYQLGTDSPSLNRTATGVALISEQGNTRFAHKVRISELTGLRRLARHYGSILQQYMPEQMYVRILGPGGSYMFQTIDAQSIEGAFDYNIEAESASQTESIRRDQTLSLFQMLAGVPEVNRSRLVEDVLTTFGRKDIQDYLLPPQMMQPPPQGALPAGQGPPQNAQQPPPQNTGGPGGNGAQPAQPPQPTG